ncbi:MAG: non-homologous end-joining DNA ligase [Spirochaetota bacterium]
MSLKEYKRKRQLSKTPEPKPVLADKDKGKYLIFVVHKHASRNLHYDLRLELQGVLKSFAIPKGPSLDPSLKRLAVMVEDHPFDYKDFEGVIPEGNYGAGSVIIWDSGFYSSLYSSDKKESEKILLDGIKKGDFKFILAGEKLRGEFALVRTKLDNNSWLLLKKKDKYSSAADVLKQDRSVLSDKTIEEIAAEAKTDSREMSQKQIFATKAQRHRELPLRHSAGTVFGKKKDIIDIKKAPRETMPHNVSPMLASTALKPFNNADWIFEIKWDGYRAIAEISGKNVLLYSRNNISFEDKFSEIVDTLKKLKFKAVLDGEIVFVGKNGKPDFFMLQDYHSGIAGKAGKNSKGQLIYYVFDVLHYEGRDLTGLELVKRKEILEKILPDEGNVRISTHVVKDGIEFFSAARKKDLEGIVAKQSKSRYMIGTRSRNWLKIKLHKTQDCVIAGFTEPRNSRKYLGSLILGAFEKNKFIYVGHSGGGFHGLSLKSVYEKLQPLIRESCPFKTKPPESETVTWVKPELVCEISFAGWTKEKLMRQPNFLRFREDKAPEEAIVSPPNPPEGGF